MTDRRPLTGLVLVALLALPVVSAITPPTGLTPNNGTRAFISDDRDPDAGTLPPFVLSTLDAVVRAENVSVANISRIRDFSYATTQPPYRVGPNQQTLSEYRLAQLNSIQRNDSTSLWLPDSKRSNGTVVKDAHITILGTNEGVRTGIGAEEGNHAANDSDRLLIPRNGTVLTQLDYSTLLPNRTCTVAGDTKTCLSYDLLEQQVDRSVRIGTQTWESDSASARQLEYEGAKATEPTTLQVRATITSTVAVTTKTYVRDAVGWQLSNTTADETLSLSHTVQDSTPAVVTSNQNLSVTQTVVRSEEGSTESSSSSRAHRRSPTADSGAMLGPRGRLDACRTSGVSIRSAGTRMRHAVDGFSRRRTPPSRSHRVTRRDSTRRSLSSLRPQTNGSAPSRSRTSSNSASPLAVGSRRSAGHRTRASPLLPRSRD
ncbi:hypothetical protein ACFQH3_19980 [Haladaptatus sp. GCM10025707]|uniref:hypothetical protein n=1 Tax=Haladaptatus sp. GCM10025707 TaxID=3252658 RepID=UPI0036200758